jgi:quercetin dioxygenase-like cupin family protein
VNIRSRLLFAVLLASAPIFGSAAETSATAKVTPLLTKPLGGIEGQEGLMLTVELPPGAGSPPHRHNASTFVYVLEGTVVMQVRGGEEKTLTAGQTFFESAADIHTVSRNASKTTAAKFLVVMVKAVGAPATVPVK